MSLNDIDTGWILVQATDRISKWHAVADALDELSLCATSQRQNLLCLGPTELSTN